MNDTNECRPIPADWGGRSRYDSSPILLLDANREDASALSEAFREVRLENPVVVFHDSVGALNYLRIPGGSVPALILCDLSLGESGGRDFLAEINADATLRTIPTVAISGPWPEHEDPGRFRFDIAGHMIKPSDIEGLIEIASAIKSYRMLDDLWKPEPTCGTLGDLLAPGGDGGAEEEDARGTVSSGVALREFVGELEGRMERVGLERRRSKRHALNASIVVYAKAAHGLSECLGKAWGLDISHGGLGFLTRAEIAVGRRLIVNLEPVVGHPLRLELLATRCQQREETLFQVAGAFLFDCHSDAVEYAAD